MKKLFLLFTLSCIITINAQDASSIVTQHLQNEKNNWSLIYQNVTNKAQFMTDLKSSNDLESVFLNHLGNEAFEILKSSLQVSSNSGLAVSNLGLDEVTLQALYKDNIDIIITRPCFECGDGGPGGGGCNEEKYQECLGECRTLIVECDRECDRQATESVKKNSSVLNQTWAELSKFFCKNMCLNKYLSMTQSCQYRWCSPFGGN